MSVRPAQLLGIVIQRFNSSACCRVYSFARQSHFSRRRVSPEILDGNVLSNGEPKHTGVTHLGVNRQKQCYTYTNKFKKIAHDSLRQKSTDHGFSMHCNCKTSDCWRAFTCHSLLIRDTGFIAIMRSQHISHILQKCAYRIFSRI